MRRPPPALASAARASLTDADASVYWLDRADRPAAEPALTGSTVTDLLIVGGGYTGLWAAIHAKERDPDRDVVVLEGERVAFGASGRNGGMVEASLTHGLPNGIARFPGEIRDIQRLAYENFDGMAADLERLGIEASWHAAGHVAVATATHEVDELRRSVRQLREHGECADYLERDEVRAELDSPCYLGGVWIRSGGATVDPARLAWGLRTAALRLGVRLHEHSPVERLEPGRSGVTATCASGRVTASRVLLASGAHRPLLRSMRRYVAPVYDYVLVTEPLTPSQRSALGWRHRQGFSGEGSRFTYYRLTDDGRLLWGGYRAVYPFGGRVDARYDTHTTVARELMVELLHTFPQLEGIRITHHWGGAVDMNSRFSVMFGLAHAGRTACAVGYTGLGVAATRFGGHVAVDILDGRATDATRLRMVSERPMPIPPEPLRWPIITGTQWALSRAEARGNRPGPWLRLLDRFGVGFGS